MLKFSLKRDADTNKVVGLSITYGVECSKAGYCNMHECKYAKQLKTRSLLLSIYHILYLRFNINAYEKLDVSKQTLVDLSGTNKCPYKKQKIFHCYECTHCGLDEAGTCNHPDEKVRDRANKRKKGVICEHFKTI